MYSRKVTIQEVKSAIEARRGVLDPSQVSTPRDAADTTPIHEIELFLELSSDNAICNFGCDLIFAIDCMEMWWIMIPLQDSYCDPKETAYNWHL